MSVDGWIQSPPRLLDAHPRVEPDAEYRALWDVNLLSLRCGHRAATAHQNASDRAFSSAQNAAEDCTYRTAHGDATGLGPAQFREPFILTSTSEQLRRADSNELNARSLELSGSGNVWIGPDFPRVPYRST
jgi:hypothetical protein